MRAKHKDCAQITLEIHPTPPPLPTVCQSQKDPTIKPGGRALPRHQGTVREGERRRAEWPVSPAAGPVCSAFYTPSDWPQPRGPGRPQPHSSIRAQGPSAHSLQLSATRPGGEEQTIQTAALSLRGRGLEWGRLGGWRRNCRSSRSAWRECGSASERVSEGGRERGATRPPAARRAFAGSGL